MNIELAYSYFKKLMKAGQGSARGGKYKDRKWVGDHWEYEYDNPKNTREQKQVTQSEPTTNPHQDNSIRLVLCVPHSRKSASEKLLSD